MFRDLKFDIVWKNPDGWNREPVVTLGWKQEGLEASFDVSGGDQNSKMTSVIDWQTYFLLEFTGLFDKNGLPIYHSDILKDEKGKFHEVFFSGGFFIIEDPDSPPLYLTNELVMTLEKVGDAFQNQDLLKTNEQLEAELKDKINPDEANV